ncbi:MAG: hypothetical protein ACLPYW_11990 [Acidimicrobiales bacterium]
MRRTLILVVLGVILAGAGIAVGRYVVPASTASNATQTTTTLEPTSTTSVGTTTTSPPATTAAPRSGTYSNGGQGTPHYFVSLTAEANGKLSGSVQFLYQDGQTSVVFTFSGTWQSGVATLTPETVPQDGSASQNPSTVPSAISMPYGQTGLELGECTGYLHFAESESQCQFSYSPSGAGG